MMLNLWEFQRTLSRRLAQWAVVSTVTGMVMLFGRGFWRGVGGQFIGWAMVNLGIAFFGSIFTDRRRQTLDDPDAPEIQAKEGSNLRRLLWINAGLDVLYMVGGQRLTQQPRRYTKGMGWGIIMQGLFLFIFDVFHALALKGVRTRGAPDRYV